MSITYIATDGTELPIDALAKTFEHENFMTFGIRLVRETVEYIGNTYEKLYTYSEETGDLETESNWLLV